ncbi:copper homeostasis protein CutC [Gemmatimonadota bacterium]
MPVFEVCVDTVSGAVASARAGADRIELCAGLVEGGVTPSRGMIGRVVEVASIDCVVLIRPRGGDFLYSEDGIRVMLEDIIAAREAGAFGIATGALTVEGTIDTDVMTRLIEAARPMQVTCHRAYDMARDPHEALDTLIELGVDRVLTSGHERSVTDALDLVADLVSRADGRIAVMPGGGVREENIREVLEHTGAREVHFTAFSRQESAMTYRNDRPMMGAVTVPGEYERVVTEKERVRRFIEAAS